MRESICAGECSSFVATHDKPTNACRKAVKVRRS